MNELHQLDYDFNGSPQRITLHWTGGSYTPSSLDAEHYQFLIDGDGTVFEGKHSVADQDSTASNYAAHTSQFNTKNIGIALCGMAGSHEGGDFGKYPITMAQWDAAINLCAFLCEGYDIDPDEQHLASHCEIERIHGVKQSGKWDVSCLSFSTLTWKDLNDYFRRDVNDAIYGVAPKESKLVKVIVPKGIKVEIVVQK